MKRLEKRPYLLAFLLNFTAGVFAFGWVMLTQRGLFSVAGDFNVQQIPFAMAANDAIKSGNVIWDWSLDLGSNFIGGMTFYLLGNPSFWLSLLFPSEYFMYIVGWLYVLKYAFAGLTSFAWMKKQVRHPYAAVIASMLYAFSGYMATNLLFYHFHDVVVLFPLMMLTLDNLVQKKKKGPFILAVLLNVIVNYFFFIGEVIFLVAYFIIRYVVEKGRKEWKKVPGILLEGVLGGLIGCMLLLPAALFTLENPRVDMDYTGSNSLVFGAERYLFILKGLIFPGEVMSDQSAVINRNFSSCAAYLPMVGLVLVIAFVMKNKKHWLTNMLKFCLVCAVIPIFNAAFSAFAGLYHRWYYMPILLFSLAGALVIDRWMKEEKVYASPTPTERAISKATIIYLLMTLAFILFLAFVPWNSSEATKIYRMDVFIAWSCIALAGTMLTWLIMVPLVKYRRLILTCGIYLFAIGTTAATLFLYHVANGEDAVHLHDRLTSAAEFDGDEVEYRFTNKDNPETLAQGISASANFCSTVSGSIFRFYESLGLERDVKSPEAPEGMMNLISAKYTYEKSPRENETPIQTVKGEFYTYYIYQDESVPPIGFTYDTYMTASEFADTALTNRAIIMLKTLVVPDDKEEVSQILRHYVEAVDGPATTEYINRISSSHLEESARDVVRTTSSYSVTITADAEKYAFFSIPNDQGWSAKVNGEEAEIIDINGFMAVRIPMGESRIEFSYEVPGLKTGIVLTITGLLGSFAYLGLSRKKRVK